MGGRSGSGMVLIQIRGGLSIRVVIMWDDILEKDKYILTNTPNREFEEYNGTLYYIKFLGLGRVGVCGGVVADISIS